MFAGSRCCRALEAPAGKLQNTISAQAVCPEVGSGPAIWVGVTEGEWSWELHRYTQPTA